MARFWPEGISIEVAADTLATPLAFVWQGHRHAITRVVERWRVDEGWWSRRIWRENFIVTTQHGLLALIYHEVRTGRWYLQRVYD